MKLPLQKEKNSGALVQWESCSPFVENSMAALIHRPRRVATYKISARWKSHIGISFWCGTSSTGTKKFTFLDAPPEGKLLCARCEANAVAAGIASSYRVTGLARLAGASLVDPPVMQRLVKALHCWRTRWTDRKLPPN